MEDQDKSKETLADLLESAVKLHSEILKRQKECELLSSHASSAKTNLHNLLVDYAKITAKVNHAMEAGLDRDSRYIMAKDNGFGSKRD